jgi:hypothetical protein
MLNLDNGRAAVLRPVGSDQSDTTILTNVRANLLKPKDAKIVNFLAMGLEGLEDLDPRALRTCDIGGSDENRNPPGWIIQKEDKIHFTGSVGHEQLTGKYRVVADVEPNGNFGLLVWVCWVVRTE